LVAELAHAAGLGGRARRLGDPGERARSAVTARIRDTIRRIAERHPALGAAPAAGRHDRPRLLLPPSRAGPVARLTGCEI
jgi:hypothetical protein